MKKFIFIRRNDFSTMLDVATWVKTVKHINEFEGCEAEVVFTCSDKQLNAPSNVTLLMLPQIRYVYYFSYLVSLFFFLK